MDRIKKLGKFNTVSAVPHGKAWPMLEQTLFRWKGSGIYTTTSCGPATAPTLISLCLRTVLSQCGRYEIGRLRRHVLFALTASCGDTGSQQ